MMIKLVANLLLTEIQLDEELNVSNSSFSMLGGSVLDSLDPLGTHKIEVAHTDNQSGFLGKSLTL